MQSNNTLAYLSRFSTTFIWLASLLFVCDANALTAMVDRTTVAINETIRLEITTNDSSNLNKIDLSAIEKHFSISNSSRQSHSSIINGHSERQQKLILTLVPQHIGTTAIPSLNLNKQQTRPISITITKSVPLPKQLADQSIIIEAEIDQANAVVGQQLIYTFRLLYRVAINGAEITALEIPNAEVTPLSDANYQRRSGAYNYHVVEKRYALHFKKAGTFQWTPQSLTAELNNQRRSRFGFDPFTQGEQIKLAAPILTVEIAAKPQDTNPSAWLPASELQLTQKWSKDIQNIPIGEPISHSITITAKGVTAEQLPAIEQHDINGLNIYPEKPEFVNQEWANGLAGQRIDTQVIIPTRAGSYTLPSLKIDWWNTQTQQIETAVLAEQTLIVVGAEKNNRSNQVNTLQSNINPANVSQGNHSNSVTDHMEHNPNQKISNNTMWFWLSVICSLGWLLTVAAWFISPKKIAEPKHQQLSPLSENKTAKADLLKACKLNQAATAKAALQAWLFSQEKYMLTDAQPTPSWVTAELSEAIYELNSSLYAKQCAASWDGNNLCQAVKSSKPLTDIKSQEILSLYPTTAVT